MAKINLFGVPENISLKNLKEVISEALDKNPKTHAVKRVSKCRSEDGNVICGKFEAELTSEDDLQTLIEKAVIEYEDEDDLYMIKITRSRTSILNNQATTSSKTSDQKKSKKTKKTKPKRINFWETSSSSSAETSDPDSDNDEAIAEATSSSFVKPNISQSSYHRQDNTDSDVEEKNFSRQQVTAKNSSKRTSWFSILQDNPNIFKSYQSSCILVCNNSQEIFEKQLLRFINSESFQKNSIKEKLFLRDGILVVYNDVHAAQMVAQQENLSKNIEVYKKPVPPVYKDRMLIQGKFTKEFSSDIRSIVECLTSSSFKVKWLRNCSMFLAVFEDEINIERMQKELKKLKLNETSPQILKLCRSDCVRVQNVRDGVTDDILRLSFMNKKLSGGTVTCVDRDVSNGKTAFVYFANYKDAEKLVQRAKEEEICIKKIPVKVSLFCPGIYESIEFSSDSIYHFTCEILVDSDQVLFLLKSQELLSSFYQELGNIAIVEIMNEKIDDKYLASVKPLLQNQSQELEQDHFENTCKEQIHRFFEKLKSTTRRFADEDRDRVRDEYKWNENESFVNIEISEEKRVNVFVRWIDKNRGDTKVVGIIKHVNSFVSWFEKMCSFSEMKEKYNENDFDILTNCGIIEDTQDSFESSVQINVEANVRVIVYSGPRELVSAAISSTKAALKRVVSCDMSFLHPTQREFLRRFLEGDDFEHKNIVEYIQEKLKENTVKVSLTRQGNALTLKYDAKYKGELERAQNEVRNLLKFQNITVDGYFDELMQVEEWKKILKDVQSNGRLCIIENRQASSITLVGLPLNFNRHYQTVTTFLANNAETETMIGLTFAKTKFFTTFSKEIEAEKNLDIVDWNETPGGIQIKGRACLVKKAENWISTKAKTLITKSHGLCVPGIASYLRSPSGIQFIKSISNEFSCVILLDSSEPAEWRQAKLKKTKLEEPVGGNEHEEIQRIEKESAQKKTIFEKGYEFIFGSSSVELTSEQKLSVKVSVYHGDILASNCAVMVNTVGSEFDLTLSKVSSALIEQAGNDMVEECENNPLLKTSKLRVTGAPNLTFKNIIHLITPESCDKVTEYLLEAFKTVEKNLKHSSLAIPAIGTGKIGMTPTNVAKKIKKAIDLFRQTNPKHLKQIDVVVFEKYMVSEFKNALLDHPSVPKHIKSSQNSPQTTGLNAKQPQVISFSGVTVMQGDILNSSCDVLINTVGSDFNLKGSQLSAKVLQKAGQRIHNECHSNSSQKQFPNCRITSGGNTAFKNIAHFVTPNSYDALSSNLCQVLNILDSNFKSKSVAIPAIGTGNAQLKSDDVAKAIGKAINNFLTTNPRNLKRIEVVVFEGRMLNDFQTNIKASQTTIIQSASSSNIVGHNETKPKVKPRSFDIQSRNKQKHYLVMYFTSNNPNNIEKAVSAVAEKVESKTTKKSIDDEVLEFLEEDNQKELLALEKEFDVCLTTTKNSRGEPQLEISGLRNSVNDAFAIAVSLLKNYSKAVTCAEYVTWKYEDPVTKKWIKHSLMANYELESSHKEQKNNCNTKMIINGESRKLTIDLKNMEQNCSGYKDKAKIKRFELSGSNQFPNGWLGNKHRQLVPLDPTIDAQEYQEALQEFQSSFNVSNSGVFVQQFPNANAHNPGNVIQIDRVENKRLYLQFLAQKRDVEDSIKKSGSGNPATMMLFHGTTNDICEKIWKDGFNRSYAGRNATAFGKGVYFATTSGYSHGYTQPNTQGERKMFIADVITGEYTQGQQGMIDTPPNPRGGPTDLFDSVVNNVNSPSIFVVFKDASVYPLYLITYK